MTQDSAIVPVLIEKFEPTSPASPDLHGGQRKRLQIATEHFPVGTTANAVCEQVMQKYGEAEGSMGLWLLQTRPEKPHTQPNEANKADAGYVTMKDSKYELKTGEDYYVIHFTGSGMFLYS